MKGRVFYRYAGSGSNLIFGVHNNSLRNLRRALLERILQVTDTGVLAPPFQPEKTHVFERLRVFRAALVRVLPVLHPLSSQQFCERYEGLRRVRYEKAAVDFEQRGVTRKDSHLQSFVKMEKLNLTEKPDPVPRVIQPRGYVYNVALGRYIAHGEKPLYRAIAKVFGYTTVFKGLNALESGRVMREHWDYIGPDVVAVGMDASRFDQHVSEGLLEWEHSVWARMVLTQDRPELRRLLSWQRYNKGRGPCDDGFASWHRRGCRMSGDMNTASGNCLLMCALVWSCMHDLGVNKWRLANNGDDCVLLLRRAELHKLAGLDDWFTRMGFKMELEAPVVEFEQIKFCQTQPVMVEGTPIMVRDPRIAIAKDSTSICNILDARVRSAWLYCIREGGLALTSGVPIWQDFYEGIRAARGDFKQELDPLLRSGFMNLSKGMHKRVRPVAPSTRASFFMAFGLNPDEQMSLEGRYRDWGRSNLKPQAHHLPSVAEGPTVLGPFSGNYLYPLPDCFLRHDKKNNCWKKYQVRAHEQTPTN